MEEILFLKEMAKLNLVGDGGFWRKRRFCRCFFTILYCTYIIISIAMQNLSAAILFKDAFLYWF